MPRKQMWMEIIGALHRQREIFTLFHQTFYEFLPLQLSCFAGRKTISLSKNIPIKTNSLEQKLSNTENDKKPLSL